MNNETNQAAIDAMDALLDRNLSDVEDLPEYLEQAPTGFYKLKIAKVEQKTVQITPSGKTEKIDAPAIQFTYEVLDTLELADETQEKVKNGSMINESIFLHNDPEKAIQVIKAKFVEIANALNVSSVLELIKYKLQGLEIGAQVKTKKDKKKDDTYYIQVTNCRLM